MSRTPVIAGNWKMHGKREQACTLLRDIAAGIGDAPPCEVVVFPPFVHLDAVCTAAQDTPIKVGAQNANAHAHGAHTGEIALAMLVDLGCTEVLLGHSERRHVYGEAENVIAEKVATASAADALRIMLCVGETQAQRDAGQTAEVLRTQLACVREHDHIFPRARIAYEPVWAIGTGLAATPAMAQEAHTIIRTELAALAGADAASETAILYGGSVKAANAAELLGQADVDGALVGGASLDADEFLKICRVVRE